MNSYLFLLACSWFCFAFPYSNNAKEKKKSHCEYVIPALGFMILSHCVIENHKKWKECCTGLWRYDFLDNLAFLDNLVFSTEGPNASQRCTAHDTL